MIENNKKQTILDVQKRILEIAKFIDEICRKNGINYFIAGGTALGAVRHKGFIPWDDDCDIFMTPDGFTKLKNALKNIEDNKTFVLQEWNTCPKFLEYAKLRMNGTTLIESVYKNDKNIHQGIFVDIFILHKVPKNAFIKKLIFFESKFVTLLALTQRHWVPKNRIQKFLFAAIKFLPSSFLAYLCYSHIYSYEKMTCNYDYHFWIDKGNYRQGLFDRSFFDSTSDIDFENTKFLCSPRIKDYLTQCYGDYMKLPPEQDRQKAVHALIFDAYKDYREYLR